MHSYLKRIDKSSFSAVVGLILIIGIIFVPIMKMRFGWIDDGMDIMISRDLINSIIKLDFGGLSNILIEKNLGLFRPVHWIWKSLVYVLSGDSPQIQFILHSLLVIGTSLLIFKFVRYVSKSNLGAFFAASLFLIIPINTENWVRMGPQEPLMGFLMMVSLYLLFKEKKVSLALTALLLAILSKVTVVAIVPAITAYYLIQRYYGKKNRGLYMYMIGAMIISALYLIVSFSIRTGYATYYEFDLVTSFSHFKTLLWIFYSAFPPGILFVSAFILRIFYLIVKKRIRRIDASDFSEMFFLMLFVSLLIVQSPWIFVLHRYLLPATIAGVIFLGAELGNILKIFGPKHHKIYVIIIVLFLSYYSIYLVNNLVRSRKDVMWWVHYTQEVQMMFEYIANKTPKNGKVFINFQKNEGTMEPILETGWNLELFYGRGDIQVKSIEDKTISDKKHIVVSSPTILGPWGFLSESELKGMKNLVKTESLERVDSYIVFAKPDTVARQFVKQGLELLLYDGKITGEGAYTNYYLRDRWDFYYYE